MPSNGEQYILRMFVDVQNERALTELNQSLRGTGKQLATTNRGFGNTAKGSRQLGFAIQSAGFQFTDFAVQVQGGVSATRALSQQLPQLLAGFNILNPVFALTTAGLATLAALLPQIIKLFADTEKEIRTISEISSDFEKALQEATGDAVQDTLNKYDDAIVKATGATRRLLEIQREYAEQDFQKALQRDADALEDLIAASVPRSLAAGRGLGTFVSPFGGQAEITGGRSQEQIIADNIDAANTQIAESYSFLVRQLQDEQIILTDFLDVLASLANAGLVGGPAVREILTQGGQFISDAEVETVEDFVDQLARIGTLPVLSEGQAGINWQNYLPTEDQEKTLQDFIDNIVAVTTAPALSDFQAGVNFESFLPGFLTDDQQAQRDALIAQADAYSKSLLPAVERYRLELAALDEKVKELNISEEQAAALTDQLTQKFRDQGVAVDEAGDVLVGYQDFLNTTFESFDRNFKSFVDGVARGTTDLQDLFKRMAASIVADLLRIYATQLLTGLFFGGNTNPVGPGIIGPAQLAKGGVLEGGVQTFARGGIVSQPTMFPMANGMGLMGEAGAEGIFPLQRMSNGDLGVSGAPVNVIINNNAPGVDVSATQGEGGLTIDVVRSIVAADIAAGGTQIANAVQGSFGLQRAGI